METDALNYTLTIILFIVNEENEVHPVIFYSHTFTAADLNYNTYDKELLAIFEAFKILWISQTTSYSQTTMEFHFYGLHWKNSIIL